jgi:aspartyl-tRNA(Asn)/glutamyl-tRNA(Gln) amidotransferase subunit C
MSVDTTQIKKLATLSRLSFSEAELAKFAAEFGHILAFVDKIRQVDTAGVAPYVSEVGRAGTPERADAVSETDKREAHQKNAPQTAEGFYVVPRIVE